MRLALFSSVLFMFLAAIPSGAQIKTADSEDEKPPVVQPGSKACIIKVDAHGSEYRIEQGDKLLGEINIGKSSQSGDSNAFNFILDAANKLLVLKICSSISY